MPTARELLEQADALMRRNRLPTAHARPVPVEIPVLTDAVDVPALAVDDTAAARSHPDAYRAMDGVAPEAERVEPLSPVLALDDVPVLTDAVEEIEAPTIAEEFDMQGEPSQWLEIDRGAISVTGPLPDSIIVVPPATAPVPAEPVARNKFAAEQTDEAPTEIEITAPASAEPIERDEFAAERADEALTEIEITAPAPAEPIERDEFAAEQAEEALAEIEIIAPAPAEPIERDESAAEQADEALAAEIEIAAPAPAAPIERDESAAEQADEAPAETEIAAPDDLAVEEESAADEIDELSLDEVEAPNAPPVEPPSASAVVASARALVAHHEPPAAVAVLAGDDARWDALAEEIRMQVLQRIDIFTDTGMREQLTARLQPIVDRASADLVATINQHVGQLLRAYVAEAIEREIEKWRQDGGFTD